jgi:hypothetical protein
VFESQVKSNPLTITVAADPLFSLPLGEEEIKWTVWLSRENVWKRFRTLGQVAVLEGEALEVSRVFSLSPADGGLLGRLRWRFRVVCRGGDKLPMRYCSPKSTSDLPWLLFIKCSPMFGAGGGVLTFTPGC